MFCPKCGKERDGEGKFCGGCGYRFEQTLANYKENIEDIRKPEVKTKTNAAKDKETKKQQNEGKQLKSQSSHKQQYEGKSTNLTKAKSNKSMMIAVVGIVFVIVVSIVVMNSIVGGDNNSNNGNLIASNNNNIEDVKNDGTDNNSEDHSTDNSVDNINSSQNNIENNSGNSIENNTPDNGSNPNDIEDNSNPIEDNGELDFLLYDDKYIEPLSIESSSYLDPTSNGHYFPENINDYSNDTAWVESAAGDGSGEWIQLNFDKETIINGIDFEMGYRKSEDIYFKNNRPKNVRVEFSDGSSFYIEFSDGFGYGTTVETDSIKTTYVKVIIEDVYKGSEYDDACISEIHVY